MGFGTPMAKLSYEDQGKRRQLLDYYCQQGREASDVARLVGAPLSEVQHELAKRQPKSVVALR